jgi:ribosomal-protein-alanine N-acetyltransferase
MTSIHLQPPAMTHAADLLAFELENRAFFERHINARPADFYNPAGVAAAIQAAAQDALNDRGYQFLVFDDAGLLVGRVNLSRVRRVHFHSAELGYRVAESAAGRGIATQAVAAVIQRATELGLVRLEATARAENIGSCTVLQRNGFEVFGRSTRSVELHGEWFDLQHFERRLTP